MTVPIDGRYAQDAWMIPIVLVLAWVTIARAMLVFAQKLPPTCVRCGPRYERRHPGEPVCGCHHS